METREKEVKYYPQFKDKVPSGHKNTALSKILKQDTEKRKEKKLIKKYCYGNLGSWSKRKLPYNTQEKGLISEVTPIKSHNLQVIQ